MNHQIKLSIGMIFKDNIRSLERCLKALQPLRDAVPCELIMADTGSSDGSRAIAERYADIVFDFPWINDFAAARNAVMDRSSGAWYFSIDTDEYLTENITDLVRLVQNENPDRPQVAAVTVRNYDSYEMDGTCVDFYAIRLLDMSTGMRFAGKIHECWPIDGAKIKLSVLRAVVLDHDGYVGNRLGGAKMDRNITLLREKLKEQKTLVGLMQFLESGATEPDFVDKLHEAVDAVVEKWPAWQTIGPPILRHAVIAGKERGLEELEEWTALAKKMFPRSFFTRIDVGHVETLVLYEKGEYEACVREGKLCLDAYEDFWEGRGEIAGILFSTVNLANKPSEQTIRIITARAALDSGHADECAELLKPLRYTDLTGGSVDNLVKTLRELTTSSGVDTSELVKALCEGIAEPIPSKRRAEDRQKAFYAAANVTFAREVRAAEKKSGNFHRHSYELFLPLENELGFAARMLSAETASDAAQALAKVRDWLLMPIQGLLHALELGVSFPDRPLPIEQIDSLAARLAEDREAFPQLVCKLAEAADDGDWQAVAWVRGLILSAVRTCRWDGEADEEYCLKLTRMFVKIERQYLPQCFTADLLQEKGALLLPPIHRFGYYCAQAFHALDAGDPAGYVRHLREGLSTCEGMKDMVEFLIDHTPQLQAAAPSQELLELADKVRAMLSAYDPSDPTVAAIKRTPAYRKVAYLIEGVQASEMGGLKQ